MYSCKSCHNPNESLKLIQAIFYFWALDFVLTSICNTILAFCQ